MLLRHFFLFTTFLVVSYTGISAKDDFDTDSVQYINSHVCKTVPDPLKSVNTVFFYFNGALDFVTLYPIAKIYDRFTSYPVKKGLDNFLTNLDEPYSAVSSLLQGKLQNALLNFWSFLINSTLGIGGIGDIATEIGIEAETQNLGNTLAYYGAGPGPYIVLPVLGMMTARDLPDKIFKTFLEPMELISSDLNVLVFILNNINTRQKALAFSDSLSGSVDIYSSIKSIYIQKRENEVPYPSTFRCKF